MRITNVRLENFLVHRDYALAIPPGARCTLISGPNGSGKTALLQAIRLALTDTPVRTLTRKNELASLISHGEDRGFVTVDVENGKPATYRMSLKTGSYSEEAPALVGIDWCLDPRSFLVLPLAERRKHVLRLAGVSHKAADIAADLIGQGHHETIVNDMLNVLAGGFDNGVRACEQRATEARGGWKAITGEAYGEVKAADWKRAIAAADTKEFAGAKERHEAVSAELAKARGRLMEIQAAERQHAAAQDLKEKAGNVEKQRKALADAEASLELVKERRDMLEKVAASTGQTTAPCPKCGTVLEVFQAHPYVQVHVPTEVSGPAAVAQAKRAREDVRDGQEKVKLLRAALASCEAAKSMMDTLPEAPGVGAADKAQAEVSRLIDEERNHGLLVERARQHADAIANAKDDAKRAAAYHAEVLAYTRLAEAIKALPARYMGKALEAFNGLLHTASVGMEATIHLGTDGELYLGQVPYWCASRSQQWRMEAAMGYAIAVRSNWSVVVLDELDVIEPARRGAALGFMLGQDKVQFIAAATLKAKPADAPGLKAVWLGSTAA